MSRLKILKMIIVLAIGALLTISLISCGKNIKSSESSDSESSSSSSSKNSSKSSSKSSSNSSSESKLSGNIIIDGSSSVYPLTSKIAEEFKSEEPGVKVSVAMSGTGGGMKKFVAGEIDICDASRQIKQEEIDKAKEKGIDYIEVEIAYDGIIVAVNKDNDWADSITVEELNKIWSKDSKIKTWKEVNPKWPSEPLKLYGPGKDSGTFEFFTDKINKKASESRKDYTPSEDDNALVKGVTSDKNALGYFGFAYYFENKDKLKALKIDAGKGPVEPSFDTILDKLYNPLTRPLFIYINKTMLEQPQVKKFVNFYLEKAETISKDIGYVPLESYDVEKGKIK